MQNETQILQFEVNDHHRGERLDMFLARRLGAISRMKIRSLILEGNCRLNGEATHAGRPLKAGDQIRVVMDSAPPTAMNPEHLPLNIVFEDDDLIVVDKAAGMLVHPTKGVKGGTLANALVYHLNRHLIEHGIQGTVFDTSAVNEEHSVVRPGLVHRLDKATSGLIVVAKNQRALSILSRHVHHKLIDKSYRALVHGRVQEDNYVIDAPIGQVEGGPPHWNVVYGGKAAESRLRVLQRGERSTLVELVPVTGRTNQLRIHCSHLGHPIVGDPWYAGEVNGGRLCLHAARLGFHHPSGGDWKVFDSPLPNDILEMFG
jgi:23S rRNA pseudouridine1911/1915/1917 synthase